MKYLSEERAMEEWNDTINSILKEQWALRDEEEDKTDTKDRKLADLSNMIFDPKLGKNVMRKMTQKEIEEEERNPLFTKIESWSHIREDAYCPNHKMYVSGTFGKCELCGTKIEWHKSEDDEADISEPEKYQ